MCCKTHGHVAAYTAVSKTALELAESRGLKWYRSSDKARRGFCGECGASLFWEPYARDYVAIAAGTPAELATAASGFEVEILGERRRASLAHKQLHDPAGECMRRS